jgi:hypothetical protein
MTATNGRGGKRPGAGRPVAGEVATEPRTVTLLPHHWAMFDADNVSMSIRETLDRLTLARVREREYLQSLFATGEMAAIVDVCNGWIVDTASVAHVAMEIEDALPDGLAEKWAIDGPALLEKLENLGYFSCWVLTDAITRWWNRVGAGEELQPSQLFID